jgi:hypothetical protein
MLFKKKEPEITGRRPLARNRPNTQVFSYHSSRAHTEANTGRTERPSVKRDYKASLANIPSILAVIAIVIALAYATTLSANPRIVIKTTSTAATRNNAEYQTYTTKLMHSSIFNKSKLTINTEGLALQLLRQYPEFQQVSVTVPVLGRRPVITVTPTVPTFVVRAGSDEAFYVNADGKVIMQATGNVSLPVVVDQSGLNIQLGKQILTKGNVAFLSEVIRQLAAKQLTLTDMTLPPVANELHVRIEGKPYYVKFNMTGDSRLQAGTYLALDQKLTGDKVVPKEYVDVRVEERVYYK